MPQQKPSFIHINRKGLINKKLFVLDNRHFTELSKTIFYTPDFQRLDIF